jgi:hypothetical protein
MKKSGNRPRVVSKGGKPTQSRVKLPKKLAKTEFQKELEKKRKY